MKLFKNKTSRILLIHTDGNSFNNPSLKCIIDLLVKNNFIIDLRYPKSNAPMPLLEGIRLLPYGKVVGKFKKYIFDKLLSVSLMKLSVFIEHLLYYKTYDLIIGVDRQGLIEASMLSQSMNTPYIFISFEIMFAKETSSQYKKLEKVASKNVAGWIVQDEQRAQKLKIENGLNDLNKFILPLASASNGEQSKVRLRDQLGVPKSKKVAIVVGSIGSPWSMTKEIIESVCKWPKEWVLIIHERYGQTRKYLENELFNLEKIIGEKIFISECSTEMVDDMGMILSGVDVGLAFYKPTYSSPYTGDNLKYLGLASGKISTYLRYSIPVIVNEVGLFEDVLVENNIGLVASEPREIREKLTLIKNIHNDDVGAYFSQKLDFNIFSKDVLSVITAAIDEGI